MSGRVLSSCRSPFWTATGWLLIGGTVAACGYYLARGPKIIAPQPEGDIFSGAPKGTLGTITEQLNGSRFVLAYQTIQGQESDLHLKGVIGSLDEPDVRWALTSPAAERQEGRWTLQGPMGVQAKDASSSRPIGHGNVTDTGPALRWEKGAWEGLAPLTWENLDGAGKGQWHFPAGWRRTADGRLVVEHGPVIWESSQGGSVNRMEAASLEAKVGFQEGRLRQVKAQVQGGQVIADVADLGLHEVRWPGPLRFDRDDGWVGEAAGGVAPRPAPGQPLDQIELKKIQAHRVLPKTLPQGVGQGEERLISEGARWTNAGLRLEGNVSWDQPLDGLRLLLKAPRILLREGTGNDLPEDLLVGTVRAEGQAVLTWGRRSLSSPRMDARRAEGSWVLAPPVLGRSEEGTFSAGKGVGNPRQWAFEGPVEAALFNGGNLRGARLLWVEGGKGGLPSWILSGRPATWTRLRERLSGPKIMREGEHLQFPGGIEGALATSQGDLNLRAEQGDSDASKVQLSGRVECQGLGWRIQADRIVVILGSGRIVKNVRAEGSVILKGRMGEGRGEALDLDPNSQMAKWQGKVRGLADVGPF